MRESDYTIDEIFEKKLYFLIPFYIFNLESKLKEYDEDEEKRNNLTATYSR